MTDRKVGTRIANSAMTSTDTSDLIQSPQMSGFVKTPQQSVIARCTPIQSMSSDVTRYSPSTGKCQVDISKSDCVSIVRRFDSPKVR